MKTNAMRLLDANEVEYKGLSYDLEDGEIDGISVARKLNKSVDEVYKTLILQSEDIQKEYYVFIIPVNEELDLKKAAKVVSKKKVDMIPVKDIEKITGYIRGGCSPIGMKKLFPTFIQEDAVLYEKIIVSAGKIGSQIQLNPEDLVDIVEGEFVDIIK